MSLMRLSVINGIELNTGLKHGRHGTKHYKYRCARISRVHTCVHVEFSMALILSVYLVRLFYNFGSFIFTARAPPAHSISDLILHQAREVKYTFAMARW